MFGPSHLLHRRSDCDNHFDHDQSIHYMAHTEELEDAVNALLHGEDFTFSFDLTEYDKYYIQHRIENILGPDAQLDFQ